MRARLIAGDAIKVLRTLDAGSVRCCVTSPPYWGLRCYGVDGQYGLEPTPEAYVARMVEVFREVRRVLADDGTLWLNLGDSYASSNATLGRNDEDRNTRNIWAGARGDYDIEKWAANGAPKQGSVRRMSPGLKPKDLVGIPWRVAFALQADGWWLRQDIIWAKPNPMPESVTDRCTKAHEYLFMLTKRARYYYDAEAMSETTNESSAARYKLRDGRTFSGERGFGGCGPSAHENRPARYKAGAGRVVSRGQHVDHLCVGKPGTRNRRSVWTITTQPYKGAHFAVMPEELARLCVLAGSAAGDLVLDPFCGSGTTGAVALSNGRGFVGIDLNDKYLDLARERIGPLLCDRG